MKWVRMNYFERRELDWHKVMTLKKYLNLDEQKHKQARKIVKNEIISSTNNFIRQTRGSTNFKICTGDEYFLIH